MNSKKKKRLPEFYTSGLDNFLFLPTMLCYTFLVILVIVVLFLVHDKIMEGHVGVWIFGVVVVCTVLSFLFYNFFYFVKVVKSFGKDVIGVFSYGDVLVDIGKDDSPLYLRFGDLLYRKYYYFKREQVLPKIPLGIADQRFGQKIRLSIEGATINLSLPASRIVAHKNGLAGIMDDIREDLVSCVFRSFKKVYGIGQESIKSPKDDPQSFIVFKEELKKLLTGKYYFFCDGVLDKALSMGVFNERIELAADSVE